MRSAPWRVAARREDQCLTIRPCSQGAAFRSRTGSAPIPTVSTTSVLMRRGGDVGSRTLRACLQGKTASRSTSPSRACKDSNPVQRIWNPCRDLRSDPRRLVGKSNPSPPLDRRVSTPADSRGIDVSLLGAYGAERRAPGPRARAWVTYGFRSRRGCIHSAPGSPAPSRHSRAGWNRTKSGSNCASTVSRGRGGAPAFHRAPKARARPLD